MSILSNRTSRRKVVKRLLAVVVAFTVYAGFNYVEALQTAKEQAVVDVQQTAQPKASPSPGVVAGVTTQNYSIEQQAQGQVQGVVAPGEEDSLVFRIKTIFTDTVALAEAIVETLDVQNDLAVLGNTNLSGDLLVVGETNLESNLTVVGDTNLGGNFSVLGTTTVQGDVVIDGGEIQAPNVIYSVTVGDGLELTGTQDITLSNTDGGSAQSIFKNFVIDGTTITADNNDDTLTWNAGTGITLSSSGQVVTVEANVDELNISGWEDDGTAVRLSTITDNVGIGTTTPGYKLHVIGTSYVSGDSVYASDLSIEGNGEVLGTLNVTGATDIDGGLTVSSGINNSSGGITNAGSITGATGFTSSGTITFSGLSTGIVHSNVNGVLSSSALNLAAGGSYVTGTLPVTNGGTGITSVSAGDILYSSASDTLAALGAGSDGEVLVMSGGFPTWGVPGGGGPCATCLVDNPASDQTITPTSATATGLIVKQAASGSVDVFRVESNDGSSAYFTIDSSGNVILGDNTTSGTFTVSPSSTDPITIDPVAQGVGQFSGTITSEDLTATRTWTFPNESGVVCLTTGNCSGSAAGVGGSGTVNYLAKWSSTYGITDSQLFDDGTNVGIGSASPVAKLDVAGSFKADGNTTLGADLTVLGHATASGSLRVDQEVDFNSTLGVVGDTTLGSTLDVTGMTTIGGNVGIGSASPGYKLDVVGEFNLTDAIRVAGNAGSAGFLLTSSGGGVNTWTDPDDITSAGWLANTDNVLHPKNEYASVADFALGGTSTASANIHLQSNGQAYFGGNVGIGSSVPSANLHVYQDSPTANQLLFRVGTSDDADRFLVDEDGDVTVANDLFSRSAYFGNGVMTGPSISFQTDTNTGMYRAGADLLGLTAGGNLGFVLDANGNVGLGTSSPGYDLEIAARTTSDTALLALDGGSAIVGGLVSGLELQQGGTTYGSWQLDASGTMQFQVAAAAGTSANLDFNTSASNNTIRFWPKAILNLELDSDRAVFQSGINVGIGSASPAYKLDVVGTNVGGGRFSVTNSSGGTLPNLYAVLGSSTTLSGSTTTQALGLNGSVTSGGSVGTAYGVYSAITAASGGSITNGYGFYSAGDQLALGTFTSYAGMYIDTVASATNKSFLVIDGSGTIPSGNFGIYNASTFNNYFAGNIGIGTTGPSDLLHLGSTGGIRLTNSELANVTDTEGVLYYDENYYASGEAAYPHMTGNGGGLAFKNEDGWGALVSTANMQFVNMKVYTLYSAGNVGIGAADPGNKLDINTASTSEGVSFDNQVAISGYSGDGWLRLNQSSQFSNGVYTPSHIRADGELRQGSTDYGAYEIQTNGQLYVNDYGVFVGGLRVGSASDPGANNLSVVGTATVGNLECTDCIDTGDLKTATGVSSGTGDRNVFINDYSFSPSMRRTSGGSYCNIRTAYLSDDGTVSGTFTVENCASSGTVIRWRYVTASRDPEIFAWFDPEKGIIKDVTRTEFVTDLAYPSSPINTAGLIPIQATVFDEALLTMDIEELRRNYTFERYNKPENLSSSDELMQIVAEHEACVAENPDHPSYCVLPLTIEGIYYGKLVRSEEAAQTWATLEEQMNQASDTQGADIAELYQGDEGIEPGDVVAVKQDGTKMLGKASVAYDSQVMGAVSTSPGQVLGQASGGNIELALTGRVPVKVSNINGEIKAGDKITSSEIPGVAMKATKPGVIIGMAIEDADTQSFEQCADNPDYQCGQVLTFMNIMSHDPNYALTLDDTPEITQLTLSNFAVTIAGKVLEVEEVRAVSKLIAGIVESGLVKTQKLVVENVAFIRHLGVETLSINGTSLAEYVTNLAGLESSTGPAVLSATDSAQLATQAEIDELKALVESQEASSEASTSATATEEEQSNLYETMVTFVKRVIFSAQAEFRNSVLFMREVVFKDAVRFEGKTLGTFVVPAGATKVEVVFETPFSSAPSVFLSGSQPVLGEYYVSSVGTSSFTVIFEQEQSSPITLQWFAVLSDEGPAATVRVLESTNGTAEPTSEETPPSPTPESSPSTAPEASPTQQPSTSPTPEPSPVVDDTNSFPSSSSGSVQTN